MSRKVCFQFAFSEGFMGKLRVCKTTFTPQKATDSFTERKKRSYLNWKRKEFFLKLCWVCHMLKYIFFPKPTSLPPYVELHLKVGYSSGALIICKPRCCNQGRAGLHPETSVDQRNWQGPQGFPVKWLLPAWLQEQSTWGNYFHISTLVSGGLRDTETAGKGKYLLQGELTSYPTPLYHQIFHKKERREAK